MRSCRCAADSGQTVKRARSSARLTVFDNNPLYQPHLFQEPSLNLAKGVFKIGYYYDGDPVMFRLYQPGSGPVHSLIAGATGSGKSR